MTADLPGRQTLHGYLLRGYDDLIATLAEHVMALQARIDRLPSPDARANVVTSSWTTQCRCAYDDPRAVCIEHEARR